MSKKRRHTKARKAARPRSNAHKRGKRKNPAFEAFGMPTLGVSAVQDLAGGAIVSAVVSDCTFVEKALIAGLIQVIKPYLRKEGVKGSLEDAAAVLAKQGLIPGVSVSEPEPEPELETGEVDEALPRAKDVQ